MSDEQPKKHPCPDCKMCQWCSERRCEMCKGWLVKPSREESAEQQHCCRSGRCKDS
ncbi:MAG: hypothetical protein ACYTFY_04090 [Planctomycetota bacterium]